MEEKFDYVRVPSEAEKYIGERVGNTRVYKKYGSDKESEAWFNALLTLTNERLLSPGGAGMFCPVSRASVHKRAKDGKLTMFCFYPTEPITRFFSEKPINRTKPYIYICVSELKQWKEELEKRALAKNAVTEEELEGSQPDWEGEFLEWHSKWMKEQEKLKKKEARK